MKRLLALLLAACLVTFSLAACGSDDTADSGDTDSTEASSESSSSDSEPIKIGLVCDLTGNEATTGAETQKALEFAIEAFGGEIAGRTVELYVEDAQDDSAVAADVTKKLVEVDGVDIVFGPTQAGQKASVAAYAAEAEVPLLLFNGSSDYFFEDNDWLIGVGGGNPQQSTAMAVYAYEVLGYRSVHIVTCDNVGFRAFTESFTETFTALGGTIVEEQYAPLGTTDWSAYLAVLGDDADAILAWVTGSSAISFWQAWYDLGLSDDLPVIGALSSAFTDYYILDALETSSPETEEAVLNTIAPSQYVYSIDTEENQAFVEAWETEFGSVPDTNISGLVYEAYMLLVEAIESLDGDFDSESLRDALLTSEVDGPAGHIEFEEGSTIAIKDVYIVTPVVLEDGSHNYEVLATYENVPVDGIAIE